MTATSDFQRRAVEVGARYHEHVARWVTEQGWTIIDNNVRHESGIEIDILARDLDGLLVAIECKGGEQERTAGLRRSDNIWKILGQTLVLHNWNRARLDAVDRLRFLVVASAQPNDTDRLALPLRVAEANDQVGIVVVPNPDGALTP